MPHILVSPPKLPSPPDWVLPPLLLPLLPSLPPLPTGLFLSSSHHSVEGPSDIWLSPASRGSRRCRRFWQAGTGKPRGPDGDSWTKKRKKVHIIKCTHSQEHTYALGVHMQKLANAQTGESWHVLMCMHTRAPTHQKHVMKAQWMVNVRRRGKLPPGIWTVKLLSFPNCFNSLS